PCDGGAGGFACQVALNHGQRSIESTHPVIVRLILPRGLSRPSRAIPGSLSRGDHHDREVRLDPPPRTRTPASDRVERMVSMAVIPTDALSGTSKRVIGVEAWQSSPRFRHGQL